MRAGFLDLSELMARNSGADGDGQEGRSPLPEAVADTLKERFATLAADIAVPLQPGDLCVPKAGFDFRRKQWQEEPLILLDLDASAYPPLDDDLAMGMGRGDVVVLQMQLKGNVSFIRADRRMLEPWPRAAAPAAESGEA